MNPFTNTYMSPSTSHRMFPFAQTKGSVTCGSEGNGHQDGGEATCSGKEAKEMGDTVAK